MSRSRWRARWLARVAACAGLLSAAVAGTAGDARADAPAADWSLGPALTPVPAGRLHLPVTPPWSTAPEAGSLPATGAGGVNFYGGRVISNANVVAVFWTSGVNAMVQSMIPGFYQAILASPYMDWLTEYDTIGKTGQDGQPATSPQHVGRGTYGGAATITPMVATGTTLTADQIGQELATQIAAGKVPAPKLDANGNVDSLYMFEFPPGYTIELLGSYSCQAYCAFHWTTTVNGKSVPFGVHPDITTDCPQTCFGTFDAITTIHSHELMEAITDTEAGLANLMAAPTRPLGWTGSQGASAEVGDLCWHYFQNDHGPMNGYTVQQIWSNEANGCVYEIPICDGTNATLCRKCNQYDDGLACGGAKPACALNGPNGGKCVACTPTYTKGCTGATTVCDATTDTCVQCLENGDCKATAPVCNTTTKTCRGCESDAECATGTYCDVGADTSKGQCVACNLDAQCPAGDECSLDTHTCKPKPPPQPEGGAGDDGGNGDSGGGSGGSNGCGCTVAGGDGSTVWLLGAAVGAAALARVRRRR